MATKSEKKTTKAQTKEMTFAQMEERVRQILDELSDADTSLDEQVALGEEGAKLLDQMTQQLETLKKRVEGISKAASDPSEE